MTPSRASLIIEAIKQKMRDPTPGDPTDRIEKTPIVVRSVGVGNTEMDNSILSSDLSSDPQIMREQIKAEMQYFSSLGKSFEWKWFSFGTPPGLEKALEELGFKCNEDEVILAYDLKSGDLPSMPPGVNVIELGEMDEDFDLIQDVIFKVWGRETSWRATGILREKRANPESLDLYAVFIDQQIVSVGWSRYYEGYVTLLSGSTIEEYRGRGAYRALVAKRLQRARERGYDFAIVEAGPMSQPVCEKLGFSKIGVTRPYVWHS